LVQPGRRLIQLWVPQVVPEAAAEPARSSMRSAPMPHLSAPAPASVLRRGRGQPPCPSLPRCRSDHHCPTPPGQAEGRPTARWRIASAAASRAPFPTPGQRTCQAALRAPTRRCRPGAQRPCGPHPPTPVFASHTRSATVARRSSTASEAAIGATRRSRSTADCSRPTGSSPTGTGPSISVQSRTNCRA